MRKKIFYTICTLCVGLLFALNAWSDGGAWRNPTPQEKAYYESTFKTLKESLPEGPDGWNLISETDQSTLSRVAKGSEKQLFQITYAIEWKDINKKNAGDNEAAQAGASVMKNYSGQAKLDALNAERQKKLDAYAKAIKANNMAAMERVLKEMDAIDAKLKLAYADMEKTIDSTFAAHEAHDFSLNITLHVNWDSDTYEKLTPTTPVAGIPVYKIPGGHQLNRGWVSDRYFVFLGRMQTPYVSNGLTVVKTKRAPGAPYTSTQWIMIEVEADQTRARYALEHIKWNLLKSLIH